MRLPDEMALNEGNTIILFSDLVHRVARRPSGMLGYLLRRFPLGHKPGFDLVLEMLPPQVGDHIVEIGCGGGVFMRRALKSGYEALAIDHSPDMIANAGRLNSHAVNSARLKGVVGDATSFPNRRQASPKWPVFSNQAGACRWSPRHLNLNGKIASLSKRMASSMRFDKLQNLDDWMRSAGLVTEEMKVVPNAGNLVIARKEKMTVPIDCL